MQPKWLGENIQYSDPILDSFLDYVGSLGMSLVPPHGVTYLSTKSQSSPPHFTVYLLVLNPPNTFQSLLYIPNKPYVNVSQKPANKLLVVTLH